MLITSTIAPIKQTDRPEMKKKLAYILCSTFSAAPDRTASEPNMMSRIAYLLFIFNKKLV